MSPEYSYEREARTTFAELERRRARARTWRCLGEFLWSVVKVACWVSIGWSLYCLGGA